MTPLETVNEFMARFCSRDFDFACELVTDDVEYDNVPIGKNYGPAGIKRIAHGLVGGFDSIDMIVRREAVAGNVVLNERIDRFTLGLRAFDAGVGGVFEVNDSGKISLWRDYFDMAPVTAMLASLANR